MCGVLQPANDAVLPRLSWLRTNRQEPSTRQELYEADGGNLAQKQVGTNRVFVATVSRNAVCCSRVKCS